MSVTCYVFHLYILKKLTFNLLLKQTIGNFKTKSK